MAPTVAGFNAAKAAGVKASTFAPLAKFSPKLPTWVAVKSPILASSPFQFACEISASCRLVIACTCGVSKRASLVKSMAPTVAGFNAAKAAGVKASTFAPLANLSPKLPTWVSAKKQILESSPFQLACVMASSCGPFIACTLSVDKRASFLSSSAAMALGLT